MKHILFIILLIFLSACSDKKILPPRDINILPIVLNSKQENPTKDEELYVLYLSSKILKKELNVNIHLDDVYYEDLYIPLQCDDYIRNQILVEPNDESIDVVVLFKNQETCDNAVGCGEASSILDPPGNLYIILSGDVVMDSMVLVHEFGHILGSSHYDDEYIMNPFLTNIQNIEFDEESKKEINTILSIRDMVHSPICKEE